MGLKVLPKSLRISVFTVFICLMLTSTASSLEFRLTTTPENSQIEKTLNATSLVREALLTPDVTPQDVLAAAQADYARVIAALYEEGFYAPAVSITLDGQEAAGISPMASLSEISEISIAVKTGTRFQFGDVLVAPLAPNTKAPLEFSTGFIARLSTIKAAASEAIAAWQEAGHAKAVISDQRIEADHKSGSLRATLTVDTGPVVSFGETTFSRESTVRPERLVQIAGIPSGGIYDPDVLQKSAARLRRTGAFSSVTLTEAETLAQGDVLDIDIEVVDAKPNRFGFGAEWYSDQGLAFSGYWLDRNLLGGAERLRIEGDISGLTTSENGRDFTLGASLTVPSAIGTRGDLFSSAKLASINDPLFSNQTINLELGVQTIRSDEVSYDVAVSLARDSVEDDLGQRTYSLLTVPASLSWDLRDNALDPVNGMFLHLEAEPFYDFSGTTFGARTMAEMRGYHELAGELGVVLAGRLKLGSVIGSSIVETPPDMLFLSGGSDTVRGHGYQSLSITSGANETGGRSFLGASAELRIPVAGAVDAVAFYDIGYVGENSWIDSTGGSHSGAGVGLRYSTGFGPLRLDLAAPVTGGDGGLQVYLGVGQAF
jgi:translocation and assembly module TamA